MLKSCLSQGQIDGKKSRSRCDGRVGANFATSDWMSAGISTLEPQQKPSAKGATQYPSLMPKESLVTPAV